MGQMSFFDLDHRYAGLDKKNDPLVQMNAVVDRKAFRHRPDAVWRKRRLTARKSNAGRKPWDTVAMFKSIAPCGLYHFSDDRLEYLLRDRLSFMRFPSLWPGLGLEKPVPDAKTIRLYRERLSQAGLMASLFDEFDRFLKTRGWVPEEAGSWMLRS